MLWARLILGGWLVCWYATIAIVATRVRRVIGYSPILIFTRTHVIENLPAWVLLAYPPTLLAGTWLPGFPLFHPLGFPIRPLRVALAALAFAAGLVVFVLACGALGSSWRIGIDLRATTPLVTTGVYARIRHPIYTAFLLLFLGAAATWPCPLSLGAAVLAPIGLTIQAVREERYLLGRFGERYREYLQVTGRFLP